jgi:hypothetical protein
MLGLLLLLVFNLLYLHFFLAFQGYYNRLLEHSVLSSLMQIIAVSLLAFG